ncbi:MAG: hypothetical protein ACLQVD_11205 [Capsulimonadaceae bacterium]
MARNEPVEVTSSNNVIAVVLSPEKYREMGGRRRLGRPRRLGIFEDAFRDVDLDAILSTDTSVLFQDYTP